MHVRIFIGLLVYCSMIATLTGKPLHEKYSPEIFSAFATSSTGIVDITHQELHLNVNPNIRYISGMVSTTFKAVYTSVPMIQLDLHNDLLIDSILNQNGNRLHFIRNEDHSTDIILSDTLSSGKSTTVTIYYQGIPPEDGFGSFVQTTHETGPIIWTLSEPYGARDWWPCGQNLTDKIDSLDLWITVPAGYRAAGNGLLISEKPNQQNGIEFHWKHRYPIATYLVAFAVTNYEVHTFDIDLANGPLPIVNYLYPQDFERHSEQIESILPEMMHLYEELFIPYPFDKEKYGHAQCGFGGGMEHQTMSFMGGFSYELTAHELAHQWFGDYVTCGSWQDVWLNEGFATYLTGLTYEKILKNGRWENYLSSSIMKITSQPDGSLAVSDTTDFRRIFSSRLSYDKGAMVLHMLRWILGDEIFFEGIRQYLRDDNLRYAFSRTKNFKNHLERVFGHDLTYFFEDWFEGEGYPSYQVQWRFTNSNLHLTVNQTTSHPSVSFFQLPVEIGIYGSGKDTLVRLDVMENGQQFQFPLPWRPDSISIDPRHWIVSAQNTTEVMTNTYQSTNAASYQVYPNPAHNLLKIENKGESTAHTIYLYTVKGQLVSESHQMIIPGASGQINLEYRTPGFYYLVIKSENGMLSNHKIVVQ